MRLLLLLNVLVLVFAGEISYCQATHVAMGLGKPLQIKKSNDIIGSPYLSEDFNKGELVTLGGRSLKDVQLRYNIFNQSIECFVDQQVYDITDSVKELRFVELNDHFNKFIKVKSPDSSRPQDIFLETIVNGKFALEKKHTIAIDSDEDWFTKKITKKYTDKATYYLLTDGKVAKLGTSKKSVLNAFNNDSRVKSYMDANNVDFSSENSLKLLFLQLN